jgi:hypothetical protein
MGNAGAAVSARAGTNNQMSFGEANSMNPSGAQTTLSKQGRKV